MDKSPEGPQVAEIAEIAQAVPVMAITVDPPKYSETNDKQSHDATSYYIPVPSNDKQRETVPEAISESTDKRRSSASDVEERGISSDGDDGEAQTESKSQKKRFTVDNFLFGIPRKKFLIILGFIFIVVVCIIAIATGTTRAVQNKKHKSSTSKSKSKSTKSSKYPSYEPTPTKSPKKTTKTKSNSPKKT